MSAATAVNSSPTLQRYQALFEARFAADPLLARRSEALAQFMSMGFPSQRDEAWKYTSLRRLESRAFELGQSAPLAIDAERPPWIAEAGMRIVFVNGHYAPALSVIAPQPPGTTLVTLGEWLKHEPSEALAYLSRSTQRPRSALEHLNTAFFEDGVVIQLAADAAFDAPVHLVHLWTQSPQAAMSHPHIIVRAGRHSRCTLIEQYIGIADSDTFTNSVLNVDLQDGARLQHYRVQQESRKAFHIGHANVCVHGHAQYRLHDVSFGGSLSRLNIAIYLQGSGAHAELKGLLVPTGTQHIDAHTRIEHIAPHTTSEEDYRGIADGRGRGVFNGKVLVHPDAQKTDARQSSRNLLLSPTAEIDSKPELEIYANDVKCSHGSTTGQLDATALFYLRSRGISEADARALLIRAFAETTISSVRDERVREYLETILSERFGAAQVSP